MTTSQGEASGNYPQNWRRTSRGISGDGPSSMTTMSVTRHLRSLRGQEGRKCFRRSRPTSCFQQRSEGEWALAHSQQ
jgi:hypothetical protein